VSRLEHLKTSDLMLSLASDADGEDAYAMRLDFPENKGVHEKKPEKEK
jgi:hypothetical protein